ncbi:MAG: flagellar export chaperone FliS [Bacillota bacterium]
MSAQTAYKKYKEVQVNTANRGKLLIMLYQGCIKFLRVAKKCIEEEDIQGANNYILRSQAIIRELMYTLDREKGGELADNLYNLYDFMNRELIDANVKKDIEKVEVVEDLMLELLESWQEVANGQQQQNGKTQINSRA